MTTTGWEDRLARRIEETNDLIAALNEVLPSDVSDFYTVPTNPTPKHVDRMQSDLDALVTDHVAPGATDAEAVRRRYEEVVDGLEEVHTAVRRHSIPQAPNYDHR